MDGDGSRKQRYRRPVLPRSEPVRRFSTLFESERDPEPLESAPVEGARARDERGGSPDPVDADESVDPIAQGVRAAYRVIEEHIARGRELAEHRSPGTQSPRVPPADRDARAREERVLRYASDVAQVSLELLHTMAFGPAEIPSEPGASAGPFRATARREHAPSVTQAEAPETEPAWASFALVLDGPRRVRARVQIDPRAQGTRLRVGELRSEPSELPALSGVRVVWPAQDRGEALQVIAPLCADQPPGLYCGPILDADGPTPRGLLIVEVPFERTA